MNPTAVVPVKSAWASKINWTQAIGFVAIAGSWFGLDLDAKTQTEIIGAIALATQAATWIQRTWFTKAVTAAAVK